MDIVSAAVGLQQAKTMGQIQMAVARKILDVQGADGRAALQLIEAASKGMEQAGANMSAAALGLGNNIDVYA